jgi:hypothetical protein
MSKAHLYKLSRPHAHKAPVDPTASLFQGHYQDGHGGRSLRTRALDLDEALKYFDSKKTSDEELMSVTEGPGMRKVWDALSS